jgi:hypothetical protein
VKGNVVNRVTIALCSIAAGAALAFSVAAPAGASPTAATAPTAVSPGARALPGMTPSGGTLAAGAQSALVKASRPAPVTRAATGPLTAANQDGACNSAANGDGDMCFWFSTNFVGSLSDFFNSDGNLSDNTFLTPGLGLGAPVANNSESGLNADSNLSVFVFTGANGTGSGGFISPRQFGNFNTTFVNNIESFQFA